MIKQLITFAIATAVGLGVWLIVMYFIFGIVCGVVGFVWPIQFASSEGPRTLCLWGRWILSVGAGLAAFVAVFIFSPYILRFLKGDE